MRGIRNIIGGIWVAVLPALAQLPMPVIRVPVHLVTAPTLVFSPEGHLVNGLQTPNFRVLDNGQPQKVTLDLDYSPVSIAIAVQVNRDVKAYTPFIAKTGSTLEALLLGETGEAAVLTYNGDINVTKPFESGDVQTTLRKIPASGKPARMIDAGMRAIELLKERPMERARVLLFIGQSVDKGSESTLTELRDEAEKANVSIYALTLPEVGQSFVSDTFSLQGLSSVNDRGGFRAGIDLGRLVSVASQSSIAEQGLDPFTVLTIATGGGQMHFRQQRELESAISAVGVELRSAYILSYSPSSTQTGFHTISVEVNVPGATTHARPGYWFAPNY